MQRDQKFGCRHVSSVVRSLSATRNRDRDRARPLRDCSGVGRPGFLIPQWLPRGRGLAGFGRELATMLKDMRVVANVVMKLAAVVVTGGVMRLKSMLDNVG